MYSQEIRDLIKQVKSKTADVRIGKNGLSENILNEIKRRLEYHKVVKVKIGYNIEEDRREFAKKVASLVGAKLIEVRGYTFILAKID
ncbi:RNA-binding protein [Sulfolobus sp. A20]|uniref:YhbY family RNA-binding protein n=2 Tax=Sulfolobaceae TaxID=118883 RepID=UPI000845E729|nr:YhbY family RNA-binding protein [Sulfolobus sp. A20]TRM73399.1 RNA-binding protein [Sulfolobus sp. E5]TRM76861.1 RNA-binding protein [Sulfolobus sp. A20-N-F8]TRM77386.1 RNA-binding protein [Sulfolobus sp. B5]TRM81541.1 RNA-binding protein [Sulfolobus sp. A20-N-F6]TRM86642.1 RNA-binding protein [Sulfolobus sp. C3]TRM87097.1 RNA-binding protein [Sulfolobus sp. E3]TRM94882.1 RNA-binding protein [Sulfolobus sp. A20-N-G8]TRM98227.1 RNA-binding protein [Sulfolobus sp. F1]TRN02920.1 RNA-bindin